MDRKKLILLVGALIVAVGTALLLRSMLAGGTAPQAQAAAPVPRGPKVLVALRGLPIGTILTAESIGYQAWPHEMVQDAYFIEGEADIASLLGTVVRNPITAGEPVTQGSLVKPGDRGFLAAALAPGMRAVTVSTTVNTGVGGFVFPGDRVDLVLTQAVDGEGSALKAAETILRNLRVLATDQSTESEKVEGKTVAKAFTTVTLEVTPKIAEKIAVAETIGTLSLSLRSIADTAGELEQAIASGDVAIPAGASRAQEEAILRAAMARPIDSRGSVTTGGDVSRFQRSTVPPQNRSGGSSNGGSSNGGSILAGPPSMMMPQASGPAPAQGAQAAGRPPIVSIPGKTVTVTRGKETEIVPVGK